MSRRFIRHALDSAWRSAALTPPQGSRLDPLAPGAIFSMTKKKGLQVSPINSASIFALPVGAVVFGSLLSLFFQLVFMLAAFVFGGFRYLASLATGAAVFFYGSTAIVKEALDRFTGPHIERAADRIADIIVGPEDAPLSPKALSDGK